MGKKNEREKDGVEEKRRNGAGGTTSIRMGKRKEVNGRVGSTAYEKNVRISNTQAEEEKEEMEIALGNIRERKTTQMLINT